MDLGPKLGEGAGSEAYVWGDGQIVKLFKDGVDRRIVQYEVRVTRAAFDAGAPAPEVLDVVDVGGRPGIVFPRYDGETLLKKVLRGRVGPGEVGEIMARLHYALHAPRYQTSLVTFRQWALFNIGELTTKGIAEEVLDEIRRVLMSLPEDGALCHGDLHADNILMTEAGPAIIDWISALNASPLLDIARQHLTFTVLPAAAPRGDEPWDRFGLDADASFIGTYADLAGWAVDDLLSAVSSYMVVMAGMRMLESGSTADEQRHLADYIMSSEVKL